MAQVATHKDRETGDKVKVDRFSSGTLVVYSMKGEVLDSFEMAEKAKFYKKYDSLVANKTPR